MNRTSADPQSSVEAVAQVLQLLADLHPMAAQPDGGDGVDDALHATIEAALTLAEVRYLDSGDNVARCDRLRAAQACVRAAATATRFAVVAAEDVLRCGRAR